jgi:Tfp pilus assembly protein PilP
MKENMKMERGMEWESSSTSEKNGDMKVSSKMAKHTDQESSIKKMETFTLEDMRMANVMDLDQSTQLMVKKSSNVVSGKITD